MNSALFPLMANAGTPLMWVSMLHLLFGNILIGIFEGWLLSRIFKCHVGKSVMLVIAANYISAWAGSFLIGSFMKYSPDITIVNLRQWMTVILLGAFVITVILELPFYWLALRPQKPGFVKTLKATFLIQTFTYLILVAGYSLVSPASMMTRLKVVPAQELMPEGGYQLYYIEDSRRILRTDLSGNQHHEIAGTSAAHRNDRLIAKMDEEKNTCDLYLLLEPAEGPRNMFPEEKIAADFATLATIERGNDGEPRDPRGTWSNFGIAPSLTTGSEWEISTGFWPAQGIRFQNRKNDRSFRYAMETPFISWEVRNATQLPGDRVVFQLSEDQICILDPHAKKIALIARGKGPIVAKSR